MNALLYDSHFKGFVIYGSSGITYIINSLWYIYKKAANSQIFKDKVK